MKFTGKQSKQSVLKALILFFLFICLFSFASASYSDCTVYGNCPPLGTNIVSYIQNIFDDVYCKLTGCVITGNLNQTSGNATINNIYGELYGKNDAGFYIIDLVTPDVYVPVNNLTAGSLNGFNHNLFNLSAQYAGLYKATGKFGVEAVSGVGGENGMKLYINNTGQNNCYDHEHTSSTQPIGFIMDCLIRLNAGDNVSVRFDDHQTPVTDLRILNGNINLVRIGN